MKLALWTLALLGSGAAVALATAAPQVPNPPPPPPAAEEKKAVTDDEATPEEKPEPTTAVATFGNGCFWCTEAVFQELKGVKQVVSGYSGGRVPFPSYQQVCTGLTGHAEVIQLTYDPSVITFAELLEVFWKTHDPTTLNAQGPDHGTQYRSAVFYHDEDQREQAEFYRRKLDASGAYNAPIVTEITPFTAFYPAEKYHQNYYRRNPRDRYCRFYLAPKMHKFRQAFAEKLRPR